MKNNEVIEKMAKDISSHCSDLAESGCRETNCAVCVAEKLAKNYEPISEKKEQATEKIKITTVGYGKEYGCYYADIAITGQELAHRIYFQASYFEKEELATEILNDVMKVLYDSGTIEGWDYKEEDEVYGYKVQDVKTGLKKLFEKYGVKGWKNERIRKID